MCQNRIGFHRLVSLTFIGEKKLGMKLKSIMKITNPQRAKTGIRNYSDSSILKSSELITLRLHRKTLTGFSKIRPIRKHWAQ